MQVERVLLFPTGEHLLYRLQRQSILRLRDSVRRCVVEIDLAWLFAWLCRSLLFGDRSGARHLRTEVGRRTLLHLLLLHLIHLTKLLLRGSISLPLRLDGARYHLRWFESSVVRDTSPGERGWHDLADDLRCLLLARLALLCKEVFRRDWWLRNWLLNRLILTLPCILLPVCLPDLGHVLELWRILCSLMPRLGHLIGHSLY